MTILAWIVVTGSLFCAGWYARRLWDLLDIIDESHLDGRD